MRIAITGGSGALGRALLRRLTAGGGERIVVFSRDEQKRAALAADFGWHPGVRVYAGDVRDAERLADLFSGCEVVVHAAARKVVVGHADEPREMLLTNVLGTVNAIAASRAAGVRKFLFISSDKAVCPTTFGYGPTKMLAEHLTIAENARAQAHGLRLSVIRYGNVLASTGSVLVLWRRCLRDGRPLPLSDPAMSRFWLTLPQAAAYVLRALDDQRGGEIFVPRIPAAPLARVAEALEATPTFDIIGIRPGGEKLHEELLSPPEVRRARLRNGFYVVPPENETWGTPAWLGDPVSPDFTYRSDTWSWQLSVDQLRDLIGEADA